MSSFQTQNFTCNYVKRQWQWFTTSEFIKFNIQLVMLRIKSDKNEKKFDGTDGRQVVHIIPDLHQRSLFCLLSDVSKSMASQKLSHKFQKLNCKIVVPQIPASSFPPRSNIQSTFHYTDILVIW